MAPKRKAPPARATAAPATSSSASSSSGPSSVSAPASKKARVTPAPTPPGPASPPPSARPPKPSSSKIQPPRVKKRKLAPPKPPGAGLPAGAAVNGPTRQIAGRGVVMVSRRAELGSYMRKCKALLVEEGLQSITLHALSASIPHLFLVLHSVLAILPFPRTQVYHSIKTSSVKLTDELVPDDEEEEITLGERWCSAVEIVISVGSGAQVESEPERKKKKTRRRGRGVGKGSVMTAVYKSADERPVAPALAEAGGQGVLTAFYEEDDEMEAMNG